MRQGVWSVCLMLIISTWLIEGVSIPPTQTGTPDIQNPESNETGNVRDVESAMSKYRDLKSRLLKLKPDHVAADADDENVSNHERQIRTLFPAGYSGCSCSDLAAIAAQITIFEEEVKGIGELENKMSLIATAIKQLGVWLNSGVKGPQGPEGPQGTAGYTGQQGDSGDPGSDTSMVNRGVPGPQGISGPSGSRGLKGPPGDCIKGAKGALGKKGDPGIGNPGSRGPPGPPGLPGAPAPVISAQQK